jgi:hypothetical protein
MDKCPTKSRKNLGHANPLPILKLQLAETIPAVRAQASTGMSLGTLSKISLRQAQGELLQDEEMCSVSYRAKSHATMTNLNSIVRLLDLLEILLRLLVASKHALILQTISVISGALERDGQN